MNDTRGYGALRVNRVSVPGATYFVTICTQARATGLDEPAPALQIRTELVALETDAVLAIRAAVIMPDHVHVLFTLNGKLDVGQVIGRFKSKTKPALASCRLCWQPNFYEHRLRPGEPIEEVLRYIFLNPYRSKIVSHGAMYPHFWLGVEEAKWFQPTLDDNCSFSAWLK